MLTVILPVYNGFDAVQACLDSLLVEGLDPAIDELIVIDDASSDPRITQLLSLAKQREPARITIRNNPSNLGYLASVNACLKEVEGAVILLNSDTRVCSGWATRLRLGAERYPRLAMLTPLSNNATFSTIQIGRAHV